MAPCPRCSNENPPTAGRCARCGLLLVLADDPAPARLDRELDLDRRGRRSDPTAPDSPAPPLPAVQDPGPAPAPSGAALAPAPPARRVAAWVVDGSLFLLAAAALPLGLLASAGAFRTSGSFAGAVLGGLAIVLPSAGFVLVAALVYATIAHTLAGATLGKRLAGLRVVGADGRPPDPATSAKRSAWALLSLAVAGAGLMPALASPSRRALHDLLAGTRVVRAP